MMITRPMRCGRFLPMLLLISALISVGCAKNDEVDCGPADQREAYMPRIPDDQPARVLVDSRFSSEQIRSIRTSIDSWNRFGQTSLGRSLFSMEISHVSSVGSGPSEKGDCDRVEGDGNSFVVLRDDSNPFDQSSRWSSMGLDGSNPGVTLRCYSGSKKLDKQVVLINTHVTSQHPAQFGSIALHELGHALGLDHSCTDKSGSAGYAACRDLAPSHEYRSTVMFPSLRVSGSRNSGFAETRESLRANDQERAACRYKE